MSEKQKVKVPDGYMAGYDGFEKDWLSCSALALLQMCGIAFEYKYIKRIGEPVSVRMVAGSASHKAREYNLKQKVQTFEDVPLEEVCDKARDDANERFSNNDYAPTPEFQGKPKEEARGVAVDLAVEFSAEDYESFQTEIQPATVEEPLAVSFDGMSRIIVGKLDLTLPDTKVLDLKTGKRAKGQKWCDDSQALSTYGLLSLEVKGVAPIGYVVQNVVQTKKGIKSETYYTTRTEEDLRRQLLVYKTVMQVIDKGAFIPCNSEEWKCSESWCGYHGMCPYGGKEI